MTTPLAIEPQWTRIGLSKMTASKNEGLALPITHIGLGTGRYEPDLFATELADERIRLEIDGYESDGHEQITMLLRFEEHADFALGEIGIYSGPTLAMVFSQEGQRLVDMQTGIDLDMLVRIFVEPATFEHIEVDAPPIEIEFDAQFAALSASILRLQQALDAANADRATLEQRVRALETGEERPD